MNYLELQKELENVKLVLIEAIAHAFHANKCPYNTSNANPCTCWVKDAHAILYPPKDTKTSDGVERWSGEECGYCKHSSTFHTVKIGNEKGCARVGCVCLNFEPTGRDSKTAY